MHILLYLAKATVSTKIELWQLILSQFLILDRVPSRIAYQNINVKTTSLRLFMRTSQNMTKYVGYNKMNE